LKKHRNSIDYLEDIQDAITKGMNFVGNISFDEFLKDEKTQYALIRAIEIIGEASKKISDDLKTKYTSVPWSEISGMRDKLIHDYFGVNEEVVWKTAKEDLPMLKTKIEVIISSMK
jgi:uncharacterized protein with HEPN domain